MTETAVVIEEVKDLEAEFKALSVTPSVSHSVAVIVAGTVGIDAVVLSAATALSTQGITADHIVVSRVQDPAVLPFFVKRIAKENSFKVIVVVAVLTGKSLIQLEQTLLSTLVGMSVHDDVPLVSAVLTPESLLELKATLPSHSSSWAISVTSLLGALQFESSPVVHLKHAASHIDASTLSVDTLLENFRESLKVCVLFRSHYF